MNSFPARFLCCGLVLLILLGATAASAQDVYQTQLRPMVQQYCGACHGGIGGRGARGGVSFGMRGADGSFVRDFALWQQVMAAIEDRSMPPPNTPRVNLAEPDRQRMIRLIEQCLRDINLSGLPPDPGPAHLRYLTKYEYASAVRDLLGVSRIPQEKLPDDVTYTNMNAPTGPGARFLLSRYLDVTEDVLAAAPRERVVTIEPTATLPPREAAKQTLKDFQIQAFRRPVSDEDMDRVMKLYDQLDSLKTPYEQTIRNTLAGVFSSPKFLTHVEQPNRGDAPQRIDPYDLASRLSFFIWSSVPDEQLLRLAGDGTLADPAVIEQQVRRMLADPRARRLAENFGLRWLGVREPRARTAPPATNPAGAAPTTQPQPDAMRQQLLVFLDDILRQDKTLLALVDDDQGGVLTQPAILVATAAGERTSPPRRGKWVLQTLLGELTPRGPDASCMIPSSGKGPQGPPLYAMLAANRQNADCVMCHQRLDPPGMALEGFDALGRQRAADADVTSLKQTVLDRKDDLARTLVEKMLAYALGRALEPCDRPTIDQICKMLPETNYRSSALIVGIAQSYPFNFRRPVQARTNGGPARGN